MKLLILSDSHGSCDGMHRAIAAERPTHVIHLGDHASDAVDLGRSFPMLPIVGVKGNCDYGDPTPDERLVDFDGVRVMMAHGHRYGVKSGLLRYEMAAREKNADVALFGHTHCAYCEEYNGLWLVNPGSCAGGRPTCAVVEIEAGNATCRLVRLDEME